MGSQDRSDRQTLMEWLYGRLARFVYELGRRMLGLVPWGQPWVNADDPKMVAWLEKRL